MLSESWRLANRYLCILLKGRFIHGDDTVELCAWSCFPKKLALYLMVDYKCTCLKIIFFVCDELLGDTSVAGTIPLWATCVWKDEGQVVFFFFSSMCVATIMLKMKSHWGRWIWATRVSEIELACCFLPKENGSQATKAQISVLFSKRTDSSNRDEIYMVS